MNSSTAIPLGGWLFLGLASCAVGCVARSSAPATAKTPFETASSETAPYEVKWSVVPFEESYNQPRLFVVPTIESYGGDIERHQARGFWHRHGLVGTMATYLGPEETGISTPGANEPGFYRVQLQHNRLDTPEPGQTAKELSEVAGKQATLNATADAVPLPLQRWYQAGYPAVRFLATSVWGGPSAATHFSPREPSPVQLGTLRLCPTPDGCEDVWVFAERVTPIYLTHARHLSPMLAPGSVPAEHVAAVNPATGSIRDVEQAGIRYAQQVLSSMARAIQVQGDGTRDDSPGGRLLTRLSQIAEATEVWNRRNIFGGWGSARRLDVRNLRPEVLALDAPGMKRCQAHALELVMLFHQVTEFVLGGSVELRDALTTRLGEDVAHRLLILLLNGQGLKLANDSSATLKDYLYSVSNSIPWEFDQKCKNMGGMGDPIHSDLLEKALEELRIRATVYRSILSHASVRNARAMTLMEDIFLLYLEGWNAWYGGNHGGSGEMATALDILEAHWGVSPPFDG